MYYKNNAHIHFIGIGGIGMSGIAHILLSQGYTVSGCDIDIHQPIIERLQERGSSIYNHNSSMGCHDPSIDVVVYSSAIAEDHPELRAAHARGIPTIRRASMLAELMRTKYSIAIAGSHGKTTTTSFISHILIEAGLDPTVIIGGILKNISSNARWGSGDCLVAEADESDRSFLHLYATLALVTNIDLEHLETYKNLEDIKDSFRQFLYKVPFYGKAILCIDDPHTAALLPIRHIKTMTYGLNPQADMHGHTIQLHADYSEFTVSNHHSYLGDVRINIPGRHNILNALGAIAVAQHLRIPFSTTTKALASFKGIERRFCYRGLYQGAEIFDDYGHHPTEIYHTLEVAKRRSCNKLRVIFQPHRYSRTEALWNQFLTIFLQSPIDQLIVTDIYSASEASKPGISSAQFVHDLQRHHPSFSVHYIPLDEHFNGLIQIMQQSIEYQDLVLLLGAGSIHKLPLFLNK